MTGEALILYVQKYSSITSSLMFYQAAGNWRTIVCRNT